MDVDADTFKRRVCKAVRQRVQYAKCSAEKRDLKRLWWSLWLRDRDCVLYVVVSGTAVLLANIVDFGKLARDKQTKMNSMLKIRWCIRIYVFISGYFFFFAVVSNNRNALDVLLRTFTRACCVFSGGIQIKTLGQMSAINTNSIRDAMRIPMRKKYAYHHTPDK